MAQPIAISLGSLNLGTVPYNAQEPMQWGSDAVMAALLTGDYRPDEFDEVAHSLNLVRQVNIPMKIRSTTADTAITDQQAITSVLSTANRYAPLSMTVTPTNSTRVSTFKVWGGSWTADYTNYSSLSNVTQGTLTLQCDPWIYGAAQNVGSSGAPIAAGTTPLSFTVTPAVFGDAPADIQLFVKNTGANSVRSLFVGGVSGNTSWVNQVNTSSMSVAGQLGTVVADATAYGGTAIHYVNNSPAANSVVAICSWTAPTLATDRPWRLWLRVKDSWQDGATEFRLRHVSGSVEVVGEWRTLPSSGTAGVYAGADMGAWYFPVSFVSQQGTSATTTFFEVACRNSTSNVHIYIDYAAYFPDDSSVLFETSDTGKIMTVAGGTAVVESASIYTSTGQGAGGADVGSHIRTIGSSRYAIIASQGFTGTLGSVPWTFETASVWAIATPRFFNLA